MNILFGLGNYLDQSKYSNLDQTEYSWSNILFGQVNYLDQTEYSWSYVLVNVRNLALNIVNIEWHFYINKKKIKKKCKYEMVDRAFHAARIFS